LAEQVGVFTMLAKMIYGDYPETMRELCSEE